VCREHGAALSALQNKATSESEAKDATLAQQAATLKSQTLKVEEMEAQLRQMQASIDTVNT
jgi:TolA-binding protein